MSLLMNQPSGVGLLAGDSSVDGQGATGEYALTVEGNTAWPDALPEVADLPHAVSCDACISAGDSFIDIECRCGYFGDAPAVEYRYSTVWAHCPECGQDHSAARDHGWEAE